MQKQRDRISNKAANKIRGEKRSLPLFRLLPNLVTLTSLCIALSSIKFSLLGDFITASSLLLLAGFMDGVDGRLARFLNSSSDFGAQLDSLVDFVNFGIAPSFVIYAWIGKMGTPFYGLEWAMVLLFSVCMAIRLARFNATINTQGANPVLEKYFFQGIPAPVVAAMSMLPLILHYEFMEDFVPTPEGIILYTSILAVLAASRIPTISVKKIPIKNEYMSLTLLLFASVIIGLIVRPWLALAAIGIIYALSIPVTTFIYLKIEMNDKNLVKTALNDKS